MAEEFSRNRLYEYAANSNLVLESERDGKRRSDEGKGEVETLRGKVNTIKMGERSRVKKTGNDELNKQASTNLPNKKQRLEETFETSKKQSNSSTNKFGHVLKVSQEIDNSIYQPTSLESRLAFEEFLSIVKRLIGDQPESILLGAATELLTVLKDDSSNNIVKESELSKLLSVNISGYMHKLLHTSGRISDFKLDVQTFENPSDISTTQKSNAEEGMAVVFDDEIDDENMRINDGEDENDDDPLSDGEGEDGIVNRENTYRNANEITDIHQEKGSFNDEDVLDPTDIDAYWLQRQLSKYYSDSNITSKLSEEVLETLKVQDDRFCENQLVVLLDFDKFALIKILMKNRFKLNYCIRLKQAQSDTERMKVEAEMKVDIVNGGIQILQQLESKSNVEGWAQDRLGQLTTSIARTEGHKPILNQSSTTTSATSSTPFVPDIQLNLEDLTFGEGGHLMANIRCELPEKSWRAQKKGYEEVHVPALKAAQIDSNELTAISSLPTWMHAAFSGVKSLNRIQSKMANAALFDSHNLLLCAPTGSGKTNVALLCMLGVMNQYRDPATDRLRLDEFKIVYIAPMKALVQECVQNFSKKLQPYGIICKELSGDQSLSKSELETTNIIVTTPEKWDIVTRKSNDKTFTQLVRLIIIDEIHLLHDDRGCVLEAIVARTLRTSEFSQDPVRLVGLSATLPNYEDVAAFLRVEADKGLFFFDSSYRPVPLQQQFIGVTEKKAIKKIQLMNEICYEKSLLHAGKNQILIFTHSRADTVKTAKAIRDMAVSNDTLMKFIKEDSASSEILKSESANIGNSDLKDILPYGFAVHHAGLSKSDRTLVEDLFADKHIQVLVSTATLAWGINLPCHTVIIKGTQIYSPEKGGWSELSPLDVLQMMGRAGRYGLDSEGEGIILTNHSELQYYLSLMNQQLPIESQLIKKLPDLLNAEIVAGSITNINDAAHWLGYTYLYIRMLKNPVLYNCISNNNNDLFDRRLQLAYAGINVLEKNDLIKFDRTTGFVAATYLGKISSYYYINNETISTYKSNLRSTMNEIDIFRLFSMSGEFKYLQVREEEKLELSKLLSRVPVPIKETVDEPIAKINALLQAYISRLSLEVTKT